MKNNFAEIVWMPDFLIKTNVAESIFVDPFDVLFLTLAPLADQSSRIRLGPLAVSPYELHPLKMANLLYGLNEMSRGRAMITVGGGGAVLQGIGMKRERMVRAVRECLEILKTDVREKPLNYTGELYKVYGFKAEWATDTPPLIYVGSNHPQTRRLSAKLADGLMTSDFCVPLMKDFIEHTHADLAAAGRSRTQDFRINNFWAWHIKEDAAASMREAPARIDIARLSGRAILSTISDVTMKFS